MAESAGNRGWTEEPATFAAALEELKSSGCLLLVVESETDTASTCGCTRMLGADDYADRRRLFVHGDTAAHTRSGVRSPQRDDERAVVYRTGARETATAHGASLGDDPGRYDSTASDPDELVETVESTVESLRPPSGYGPGQLRVCVDAVSDIMATDDLASALSVTNELGDVVTDVGGMMHVHFGDTVPPKAVEGFLPQFDAVVELDGEDDPRQRWHLPDESLSTAWLEL